MGQKQHEKRGAKRVACDLPILLRYGTGEERATGTLLDLSRLGVCLRVPGEILDVHRLSSLVHVARRVSMVFGPRFDAWLGGGEGGVQRTLEPVRICQRNWESRDVELGCSLGRPLSDADLDRLGIVAPPIADGALERDPIRTKIARWSAESGTVNPAELEEFTPLGATGESEPNHVGYMVAEDAYSGRPLQGTTQLMTDQDAILVIPTFERTRFAGLDIASLILAFGESYGDRPTLRILQGPRQLWAGVVRLTEVEIPASGMGPMRLRMQFEDPLEMDDQQTLGVA